MRNTHHLVFKYIVVDPEYQQEMCDHVTFYCQRQAGSVRLFLSSDLKYRQKCCVHARMHKHQLLRDS